jgi:hypothetical protein
VSKQQTLREALRAKFRTPREAIHALGLDEKLLDVPRMALDSKERPNRLQYLLVTRAARIFNPQLATDAQVDYGALFKGVNTRNLPGRRATILKDAARMLRGKTIAQDASLESLVHLLDMFEHVKEPKSLDESVSEPQHNAMAAAAGGQSNLGIPKEVGEEFVKKDDEDEDDDEAGDEDPENALEEEMEEREEGREGEDEEVDPEEQREDEGEEEEAHDEDDEHEDEDERVTKGAMDEAISAAVNAAVMTERKHSRDASRAREFVRPYVGELPMGLDSAEEILRSAALALNIDGAARVHPSALKTLIKVCGRPAGAQASEHIRLAQDSILDGLELFPEARRIGNA